MRDIEKLLNKIRCEGFAKLTKLERNVVIAWNIIWMVRNNGILFVLYSDFPDPVTIDDMINVFDEIGLPVQRDALKDCKLVLKDLINLPQKKRSKNIDRWIEEHGDDDPVIADIDRKFYRRGKSDPILDVLFSYYEKVV